MIRKNSDYSRACVSRRRIQSEILDDGERLAALGFDPAQIRLLMKPRRRRVLELGREIRRYERATLAQLRQPINLQDLGEWLIELRLASRLNQRALAARLGVHESALSRDERTAYRGLRVEKAIQVLDALGVRSQLRVLALEGVPEGP